MVNTDTKKSRQKRIWIILAVVFAAGFLYCWFFGFATMMILQTRWLSRKFPVVYVVPKALPDNSKSISPIQTFSFGDYEFEIPWNDIDERKTKNYPAALTLSSRSGQTLIARKVKAGEFVKGFLEGNNGPDLKIFYGQDVLASDYALTRYMLQTTPAQIRLTTPRKEAGARSVMLIVKAIAISTPADSGIFIVQTPGFEGFQYGDPNRRPKKLVVDLFSDETEVEFIFTSQNGLTITQPEINRVLQSLHK